MKSVNFSLVIICVTFSHYSHSMMRALNTAATGMAAQEAHVNTISNNIANSNTTGYKAQRVEFEDLMYETVQQAGGRSSADTQYTVGEQVGSGAKISGTRKIFSIGSAQITKNPYDLMIMGDGFFKLRAENQSFYTRDGSFTVDAQGNLKTKKGLIIEPGIVVPPNTMSLNISEKGQVEAYTNGQSEPVVLGQIMVYTFANPAGLVDLGGNMSKKTMASGEAIERIPGSENSGAIQQGALESSNVTVMTEMTNLIKAQRSYEMNSKVMGVADQMLQTVNNIR